MRALIRTRQIFAKFNIVCSFGNVTKYTKKLSESPVGAGKGDWP